MTHHEQILHDAPRRRGRRALAMRDMLRVVHEQNQTIHALLGTVDRYRDAIETARADAVQFGYAVAPTPRRPRRPRRAARGGCGRAAAPRSRRPPPRRRGRGRCRPRPPPPPDPTPPSPDRAPQSPAYDFAHVINPMPAKGTAGRTPAHRAEVTFAAMARARAHVPSAACACGCDGRVRRRAAERDESAFAAFPALRARARPVRDGRLDVRSAGSRCSATCSTRGARARRAGGGARGSSTRTRTSGCSYYVAVKKLLDEDRGGRDQPKAEIPTADKDGPLGLGRLERIYELAAKRPQEHRGAKAAALGVARREPRADETAAGSPPPPLARFLPAQVRLLRVEGRANAVRAAVHARHVRRLPARRRAPRQRADVLRAQLQGREGRAPHVPPRHEERRVERLEHVRVLQPQGGEARRGRLLDRRARHGRRDDAARGRRGRRRVPQARRATSTRNPPPPRSSRACAPEIERGRSCAGPHDESDRRGVARARAAQMHMPRPDPAVSPARRTDAQAAARAAVAPPAAVAAAAVAPPAAPPAAAAPPSRCVAADATPATKVRKIYLASSGRVGSKMMQEVRRVRARARARAALPGARLLSHARSGSFAAVARCCCARASRSSTRT